MFEFFNMMDNYNDRLVANTKVGDHVVDTVRVNDSSQPYETGIESPNYNEGEWVIVEQYDTKSEAEEGHKRWVETMKNPPPTLKDVSTCGVASFAKMLGSSVNETFKKEKKAKKEKVS